MKKYAIVYCSKTGFTKRYVDMLKEEIDCDVFEAKKLKNLNPLLKYDLIIYAGSVMANRINGFKIIDKNIYDIEDKKIIIVAVGLTPPLDQVLEQLKSSNIPFGFEDKIKIFQLRGGLDVSKLKFFPKMLMNSIKKRLINQQNRNEAEEEMLEAILKGADYVDKSSIVPIIEEIKEFEKNQVIDVEVI
ncbi:MAG: flavodoxin domain-containing protein [Kiritimatiellia bacterium]|nr:flavodoxin domain-containing protein [Bacilli bacterium]